MPRKPSVPRYLLHKPSGLARVIIRGRSCYLGPYGSPESREKYGRIVAELSAGRTPDDRRVDPNGVLIVEVLARYWEFAQTYYVNDGKKSVWLSHIQLALHHVREKYAHTPAAEFGPLAFKAIRNSLIDARHSRTYINKLMAVVPRVFKWAAAEELVPASVYHALRTVEGLKRGRCTARETTPVLPVDDRVVDATVPHLPPVVRDMVAFQRLTGCRPGEVCRLRPMDVDRTEKVWAYRPPHHKMAHLGRQRTIYIGPKAQEILRPYLLRAADAFCFSPAESEEQRHQEMRARRKTKVQPSQQNRRKARRGRPPAHQYVKDSYARAVARAIRLANSKREEQARKKKRQFTEADKIPHWHPNQLRHSVATEVRRQFGLEGAQVVLGHSKADTTQIYAERDGRLAKDIMRQIG